jgi:hypothetical protein
MHHFATIANRYGIDADDVEAVDNFFAETLPTMDLRVQESILAELLALEGQPNGRAHLEVHGATLPSANGGS